MKLSLENREHVFIKILLGWLLVFTLVITVLNLNSTTGRAVIGMAWILIIFWIIIGGYLMYRFRDTIREKVLKIPFQWQVTFFLFATLLALIEEAITTTATNMAPLFGVSVGQAYLTASTNYLDVVFFHSVIVFMGMFVCWALALKRYDFSAFSAFVIFGITGVIAESLSFGPQNLVGFSLWIFVYGLMIFLPAYTIPPAVERGARKPKWYHYIILIFLPFLFVPLFGWVPYVIDPHHPSIHFAPIHADP